HERLLLGNPRIHRPLIKSDRHNIRSIRFEWTRSNWSRRRRRQDVSSRSATARSQRRDIGSECDIAIDELIDGDIAGGNGGEGHRGAAHRGGKDRSRRLREHERVVNIECPLQQTRHIGVRATEAFITVDDCRREAEGLRRHDYSLYGMSMHHMYEPRFITVLVPDEVACAVCTFKVPATFTVI